VLRVPFLFKSINTSTSNWFSTACTQGTSLLMIVSFAVRFALIFEEASICKRLLAVRANKVFRVPLRSQGIDTIGSDRFLASSAFWCVQTEEIGLAVGTTIFLKEYSSAKGLQALCADKVLYVPLLSQCRNAAVQYGFRTVSASCAMDLLKAPLAVRLVILFEEISCTKEFTAV